jgi:hypothetical protein
MPLYINSIYDSYGGTYFEIDGLKCRDDIKMDLEKTSFYSDIRLKIGWNSD